jgi:ankyrin repeat protein
VQSALISLLCSRGADPGGVAEAAAGHGEFEAVKALLRCGARIDLPIAAALGNMEEFGRLFPVAESRARHKALAFASQFGRVEMVRLLLDAGEDPNRYNPPGAHSHSTPLHQAALGGHDDLVRLLVERGARLDLRDTLWLGTPADWAKHESRKEIEAYLRKQEKEQRTAE